MASISPSGLARDLLASCVRGGAWRAEALEELISAALAAESAEGLEASQALFGILAEGLADRFEPALSLIYARLFARLVARALPEFCERDLVARYERVRQPREHSGPDPGCVFVLSRVTLGADVAITSAILDALKRRFPRARIVFAAPRKNWELFEGDPRVSHLPASYSRQAPLRDRLAAGLALRCALEQPDSIVVDPDSRLTQLGLLPVCAEDRYYLFESRSYGGGSLEPLPRLAARWCEETFGMAGKPYIAPVDAIEAGSDAVITVSFGVGENPAKRVGGDFERRVLRGLARLGATVWVDKGAGGEEAQRVERAAADCPGTIRFWSGAFAPFAALIARSRLYLGYDSAGQHVAAACGAPLVCVFAGYPSERMLARWQPCGSGPIRLVRASNRTPQDVLEEALSAAAELWTSGSAGEGFRRR